MKSKETLRAGFAQINPFLGNTEKNCRQIIDIVKREKFDLLVFPELATSGYDMTPAMLKKAALNADSAFFSELHFICSSKKKAVVIGFPEKAGSAVYNSSVLINEKGDLVLYRKTHLFFNEKKLFRKGDTGFVTCTVKKAVVGQMICFDWFFPESARTLALKKADIIAHPSNLVMPYCQQAMRIRTLENNVFAVTANRIGTENAYTFTGRSQITSVKGDIIASGYKSKQCVRFADLAYTEARDKKLNPLNDTFKDRREDLYEI